MKIILVHGWASRPTIWDLVGRQLKKEEPQADLRCIDFGFFGSSDCKVESADLVVAHSLGVMWAIQNWSQIDGKGMVAIGGFTRFFSDRSFRSAVSPKILSRMEQRLETDPSGQLADFYRQANGKACPQDQLAVPEEALDTNRLGWGLSALKSWDLREQWVSLTGGAEVAIVADRQDPIVPVPMSEACFPLQQIAWTDSGSHWIPWVEPKKCVAQIRSLIGKLKTSGRL